MKNNKVVRILYPFILLIQILMWVGVCVIQNMTKKSAGVMHYVYFKRYEYSNILTVEKLNILSIITLILAVAFLVIIFYAIKNKKDTFCILQTKISLIMASVLIFVIKSNLFSNLLAYYYFVIVAIVVFLIQIFWLMILFIKSKKYSK